MCEICSKSTIKTPERYHQRLSGVIIANFEQISHIVVMFPLLALNELIPAGYTNAFSFIELGMDKPPRQTLHKMCQYSEFF